MNPHKTLFINNFQMINTISSSDLLSQSFNIHFLHFGQHLPSLHILYTLWFEILWSYLEEPLWLNIHNRPHIVLFSQHQLMIYHILWSKRQNRTWMYHHHLRLFN